MEIDLLENSIQGEDIHKLSYQCLHLKLTFIKEMTHIRFLIWPHRCLSLYLQTMLQSICL